MRQEGSQHVAVRLQQCGECTSRRPWQTVMRTHVPPHNRSNEAEVRSMNDLVERLAAPVRLRDSLPSPEECRRIRRAAGVSQDHLAAECKVGRRTVIDIEAGRHFPMNGTLKKYLAGLDACREIAAERKARKSIEAGGRLDVSAA